MRYNRIIKNELYKKLMDKIDQKEQNRKFCCHGIEHSLDVARIAYILSLENNLNLDKDRIYAVALLHDIGRAENDSTHRENSISPAEKILSACGYSIAEIYDITSAILSHGELPSELKTLGDVICMADKLSRLCFSCNMQDECNWSKEKRNEEIVY